MTVQEFNQRVTHQKGHDRAFGHWKVIDIHRIPILLEQKHEVDFYCCNGEAVYLLKLRKRTLSNYSIAEGETTYLIAELNVTIIDNELLQAILTTFEAQFKI